jgi:hypothetical protein
VRRRIQLWCSIPLKEKEQKGKKKESEDVKMVRRTEEGVGKGEGKG